jgi:hypothetical protein
LNQQVEQSEQENIFKAFYQSTLESFLGKFSRFFALQLFEDFGGKFGEF